MPPISNSTNRVTQSTVNRPAGRTASTPPPSTGGGRSGPSDGVSLSSEAMELAQTNAERCGSDWRCLQQLDQRGLLNT